MIIRFVFCSLYPTNFHIFSWNEIISNFFYIDTAKIKCSNTAIYKRFDVQYHLCHTHSLLSTASESSYRLLHPRCASLFLHALRAPRQSCRHFCLFLPQTLVFCLCTFSNRFAHPCQFGWTVDNVERTTARKRCSEHHLQSKGNRWILTTCWIFLFFSRLFLGVKSCFFRVVFVVFYSTLHPLVCLIHSFPHANRNHVHRRSTFLSWHFCAFHFPNSKYQNAKILGRFRNFT